MRQHMVFLEVRLCLWNRLKIWLLIGVRVQFPCSRCSLHQSFCSIRLDVFKNKVFIDTHTNYYYTKETEGTFGGIPSLYLELFPRLRYLFFRDFSNEEERIKHAITSYQRAEKIGWRTVVASMTDYGVLPSDFSPWPTLRSTYLSDQATKFL